MPWWILRLCVVPEGWVGKTPGVSEGFTGSACTLPVNNRT